jgi:tetratricopeptide (TPR) repeat protein
MPRQEHAVTAVSRSPAPAALHLALACLLCGAVVAAVHLPVLKAQALSLDDEAFVVHNPLVSHPSWNSVARFFGEVWRPSSVSGYYMPLTMTSLMVDHALGGRADDLRVFHVTNLVLHTLNTILVLLILARLFGSVIPAAAAALLFGLHPLMVEPLAWVGERKTLLATLFALASVYTYVRGVEGGRRAWTFTAVALFALALLAKPTASPLPLVLLLLDWWPLRRFGWRAVLEKWPFALLAVVSSPITVVSQRLTGGQVIVTPGGPVAWLLNATWLLAFYVGKLIRPVDLSCIYPQPPRFSLAEPVVTASLVAIAGITALVVFARRRWPAPFVAWVSFAALLAPTLGAVHYSWITRSDKYVYLPAVGIALGIAAALGRLWSDTRLPRGAARAVVALAVLPLLVAEARGSRRQLGYWADSRTLFRHMGSIAPDSPVVHNELGGFLHADGDDEKAIEHFRAAIALAPKYGEQKVNLGRILLSLGRTEEAIPPLQAAAAMRAVYPLSAVQYAIALGRTGRVEEAEKVLRGVLQEWPNDAEAHENLGSALMLTGRAAEGVEHFRAAVAADPGRATAHTRLSEALMRTGGDPGEIAGHLRQAIALEPRWPDPLEDLAWLLATNRDPKVRDPEQAVSLASRAVELCAAPDVNALDAQAAAFAAAGQFDRAVGTARQALELARGSSDTTLVTDIGKRVRLYERRSPYVEH